MTLIHHRTCWTHYGLIESSVRMDCTCNSWILIYFGFFSLDLFWFLFLAWAASIWYPWIWRSLVTRTFLSFLTTIWLPCSRPQGDTSWLLPVYLDIALDLDIRLHCLMLQYASVTTRMNLGTSTTYLDIGPFPYLCAHLHHDHGIHQWSIDKAFWIYLPSTHVHRKQTYGPTIYQTVINQHQACTLASNGTGPTHWRQTSCMILSIQSCWSKC